MREEYGVRKVWTLGPCGPMAHMFTIHSRKKAPSDGSVPTRAQCADVVLDTETAVDIRLQMGRSALDMKGMG